MSVKSASGFFLETFSLSGSWFLPRKRNARPAARAKPHRMKRPALRMLQRRRRWRAQGQVATKRRQLKMEKVNHSQPFIPLTRMSILCCISSSPFKNFFY